MLTPVPTPINTWIGGRETGNHSAEGAIEITNPDRVDKVASNFNDDGNISASVDAACVDTATLATSADAPIESLQPLVEAARGHDVTSSKVMSGQEHGDINAEGAIDLGADIDLSLDRRRKDTGALSPHESSGEGCKETDHVIKRAANVEVQNQTVVRELSPLKLKEMDVPSSDDVDLVLAASSGKLGLSLQFDDNNDGALITAVDPQCALKGKISVGDRLVTIDGISVKDDDLPIRNNKHRLLGIATKKGMAAKEPASTLTTRNTSLKTETSDSEGRAVVVNIMDKPLSASRILLGSMHSEENASQNHSMEGVTGNREPDHNDEEAPNCDSTITDTIATTSVPDVDACADSPPPLNEVVSEHGVTSAKVSSPKMKSWKDWVSALEEFKQEHGCSNFGPMTNGLRNWCWRMRKKYKEGNLSDDQVNQLERLEFKWVVTGQDSLDKIWENKLQELVDFKEQHGHCNVKGRTTKLGQWVDVQRSKKKVGKISAVRIARLDEIGFTWGKPRSRPQENVGWEKRFSQLQMFAQEHGHCNIPNGRKQQNPLRKLVTWMIDQRISRKKGKLSKERIRQLDDIGFAWNKAQTKSSAEENQREEERLAETISRIQDYDDLHAKDTAGLGRRTNAKQKRRKKGIRAEECIGDMDHLGLDPGGLSPHRSAMEENDEHDLVKMGVSNAKVQGQLVKEESTSLNVDLTLNISQGQLGLSLQFDDGGGALITAVHPHCSLKGKVSVGDRLVTIHGKRVMTSDDLLAENDEERVFGFAKKICMAIENPATPDGERSALPGMKNSNLEGRSVVASTTNELTSNSRKLLGPTPSKEKMIPHIGSRNGTYDAKWEAKFDELLAYKQEHGDCQVPQRYSDLGRWVKNQRYSKKKLSEARITRLEEVGFTWTSTRASHHVEPYRRSHERPHQATLDPKKEARWDEMYAQLKEFRGENGHFKAPLSSHSQLRRWIDKQRHSFKQNMLPKARIARLEAIGFDLGVRQSPVSFEDRIAQLKEYFQQSGNCDVPLSHPILGKWVWQQRNEYKKMNMSEKRIKLLEASGFEWQLSFEGRLMQLQQYAKKHGNCNPPQNHVVLGDWVKSQRHAHKKKKLSEEHTASLDSIGFSWGTAPRQLSWENRLEMLQQYKLEFGNCTPPRSHPQLGCWVDNQRRFYKKGKLTQERIAALNELGFNWGTTKKDPDLSWQEQYNQLVSYMAEHGNCDVPQSATGLGRFVHWQRCIYKKGKISEGRVNLLNKIGFNWGSDAMTPTESWESRFAQLQRYKEEHGDCEVPRNHADLAGLRRWVLNQRRRFEKMPDSRRTRIVEIGLTPIANT